MRLVPVTVFLLWPQLFRQFLEDDSQELITSSLVLCVSVPDSDLDCVPTNAIRDTADVVVEG